MLGGKTGSCAPTDERMARLVIRLRSGMSEDCVRTAWIYTLLSNVEGSLALGAGLSAGYCSVAPTAKPGQVQPVTSGLTRSVVHPYRVPAASDSVARITICLPSGTGRPAERCADLPSDSKIQGPLASASTTSAPSGRCLGMSLSMKLPLACCLRLYGIWVTHAVHSITVRRERVKLDDHGR